MSYQYTPTELFNIQCDMEQEMLDKGIKRYRKNLVKTQEKGLEADSNYGNLLMKQSIDKMVVELDKYIRISLNGDAGVHATAAKILSTLDLEVCSYLALKTIVNGISKSITLTQVCVAIGQSIHDQHLGDKFQQNNKLWFKSTMDYVAKRKASRHHKKLTMRKAADKANTMYNTWATPELHHIGSKLVDVVIQTTGMVKINMVRTANKKTTYHLNATPEILDWIRDVNAMSEVLTPEALPFVIPPKDWKTVTSNVTHSKVWIRKFSMIKTRNRALLEELDGDPCMQKTIDGVNALQQTAFKINKRIIKLQRQCWESDMSWGGIPARGEIEMPPSPFPDVRTRDLSEEEQHVLWKYKKVCQGLYEKNTSNLSKQVSFELSLKVAERFQKFPALHFIYQCDYRGRVYPIAQYLSPQANSIIKAQLTLANGAPIDTYEELTWLYHHAANVFGYDKKPIAERIRLIEEMMPEIIAIDNDPLNNTSWKDCEDPWNFLAACFEIAAFQREGYGFVSHIGIALDATNSGLQIYSSMLRDEAGAKATNVTASETPADVYRDVAEITERKLMEEALLSTDESVWAKAWLESGLVTRFLTKTPTMTKVYSATLFSCRDSVRDKLTEKFDSGKAINPFGKDEDAFIRSTFYLAKVIWSSISECVVSAQECMDWMTKIARDVSKLQIPIIWQTPSGFKVIQQYPEYKSLRIQTHIDGHLMRPRLSNPDYQKVDKKKAASGLCPNFIHSLDSSFLILTILKCQSQPTPLKNYWMIHDSFSTTAKHAATLARCLREEYVRMFTEHDVINDFRDQMLKSVPEVDEAPKRGNLDINEVIHSKYFFN